MLFLKATPSSLNIKAWQSHTHAHTFDLTTSSAAGAEGAAASLWTDGLPGCLRNPAHTLPPPLPGGPTKKSTPPRWARSSSDRWQETPALGARSPHSSTGLLRRFCPMPPSRWKNQTPTPSSSISPSMTSDLRTAFTNCRSRLISETGKQCSRLHTTGTFK